MIVYRGTSYGRIILVLMLTTVIAIQTFSQSSQNPRLYEDKWVDSVYQSLTIEQRIAQLIFVRANYANKPYIQYIDTLIADYNIGGVVFF